MSPEDIHRELKRRKITGYKSDVLDEILREAGDTYRKVCSVTRNPDNDARFKLSVSKDSMQVYLDAREARKGGSDIREKDIYRALEDEGISVGVRKDRIQEFMEKPVYNELYVVASGEKPVPGADARFDFKFTASEKGGRISYTSKGEINFKNLNLIQNVFEGDILAVKLPAEDGKEGRDVYGNSLPTTSGKDTDITLGNNVAWDIKAEKIIATRNGNILITKDRITVETSIIFDEGVSIKTGDITVNGTAVIKGNIEDGFSVKATGNIVVYGTVGRSSIESEGNIILKNGINGGESDDMGYIRCEKSLWASYITNATVEVDGDIFVSDGILKSHVSSGRKIYCRGKRARIVGGVIRAKEEINASVFGSMTGTPTHIEVGYEPILEEEMEHLETQTGEHRKKQDELRHKMKIIDNQKHKNGTIPLDRMEYYTQLEGERKILEGEINEWSLRIAEIKEQIERNFFNGRIVAVNKVYPEVLIKIKNVEQILKYSVRSLIFQIQDGYLKTTEYSSKTEADRNQLPDIPSGIESG